MSIYGGKNKNLLVRHYKFEERETRNQIVWWPIKVMTHKYKQGKSIPQIYACICQISTFMESWLHRCRIKHTHTHIYTHTHTKLQGISQWKLTQDCLGAVTRKWSICYIQTHLSISAAGCISLCVHNLVSIILTQIYSVCVCILYVCMSLYKLISKA